MNNLFAEDIKDVKPPVDLPPSFPFWIILLFLILIVIFILFFLKNKLRREPILPEKTLLPWETALKQLEILKNKNFFAQKEYKTYYSELSDIIRRYIEGRFQVRASEMTTEEFLNSQDQAKALTPVHKTMLRDFLNSCDLVKFARHSPEEKEAQESYLLAKRFVDETIT